MEIQDKIQNLIKEVLTRLDIKSEASFVVEHPADMKMGDYSTNVAMVYAKQLGMNPKELAEKIVKILTPSSSPLSGGEIPSLIREGEGGFIEKIEVAGPGFINFYLSKKFFFNFLNEILEDEKFGKNNAKEGEIIMVEYTDPNPFKPFHIGHLMSNSIGESLSRLVEYSGAETIRANYQGDVGLHVAKAIYGILQKGIPDSSKTVNEQAEYIGECYSFASNLYEEDEEIKKEINKINKQIYEKSDEKINEIYMLGRVITLEAFENIYKLLGTKFKHYFFESDMADRGTKIVRDNMKKAEVEDESPESNRRIFEESNGAIVFHGEKHDPKLHTRVFINSEGLPTYETKEIGLTVTKFEKENPDTSIVITAIEQGEYMRVVAKAISLIYPEYESRMRHITHGMLRFATGKMSSRKGNIITGESLIKDVSNAILEKIKDRDFTEGEKTDIANKVGVGALKFSILKQAPGGDIIYDFEKSISFEGDSGPYLQYSFARANSLLNKAKEQGIDINTISKNSEILEIEKMLYKFPEVVIRAQEEYAPHYITHYLLELARAFNSFYGNNQIVNKEDESSPYKLAITSAFARIMQNGLYLLGIESPEKM
ncbi:MAG: arginine--tRNA ligase [Candidatus Pacebacteria bacterium]|nr:arginine--tRNA ligase [Candidatus Paceibacterota bacterium]